MTDEFDHVLARQKDKFSGMVQACIWVWLEEGTHRVSSVVLGRDQTYWALLAQALTRHSRVSLLLYMVMVTFLMLVF